MHRPAPFAQTVVLPLVPGSLDKTLEIYGAFADLIHKTVPDVLEWSLFQTKDGDTGNTDVIITERYVSDEAHDKFVELPAYKQLLDDTFSAQVLRGAPVVMRVEQVGGFLDRGGN